MRRHIGKAGGPCHIHVGERREDEKIAAGRPLTWPGDPKALPYLDTNGSLVLPVNAPHRFRWWTPRGQSVKQTMTDLGGVV